MKKCKVWTDHFRSISGSMGKLFTAKEQLIVRWLAKIKIINLSFLERQFFRTKNYGKQKMHYSL